MCPLIFLLQPVKYSCPSLPLRRLSCSWTAGLLSHHKSHSVLFLSLGDQAILCLELIFIIYKIIKCLNASIMYYTGNTAWYLFYLCSHPSHLKADFWSFWGLPFQGFGKYYMLAVTLCSSLISLLKSPFIQLYFWETGGQIPCEFWMFWCFSVLWIPNVQVAHCCSPLSSSCLYELCL